MSDPITRLNAALEGRYRIERQLGEGGMATVYLADDLRHERKVALKVLKPELAAVVGAERFLAEIKTTANLQHPHILPLFDSGEADTFLFYVMPYVEGESLRERLDREHQLPVDEAVQIAKNVAEALEYAHSQGVIHRDIKPANILLQSGKPVVSDFGIALAVGVAGGGRLTETGLSLGTPHYMSPEQATGDLSVGATTDVYALGCVLYEMLIAEPPYTGGTPQAILGKIVTGEADPVTKHRRSVPSNVDAAIRKALEKVPADRFRDAQGFGRALSQAGFEHGAKVGAAPTTSSDTWRRVAVTFAVLFVFAGGLAAWALTRPTPPVGAARFDINLRDVPQRRTGLALSPDGRRLVTRAASPDGETRLYRTEFSGLSSEMIEGTAGSARHFAISPDGEDLAFIADGALKSVSINGGTPTTLVPELVVGGFNGGLSWGNDGLLYFVKGDQGQEGIWSVPGEGGEQVLVREPQPGEGLMWLDALPDGSGLLFVQLNTADYGADLAVLSFESDATSTLIGGSNASSRVSSSVSWGRYAPSGHIVYTLTDGTLWAAPFDLKRQALSGPGRAHLEGVRVDVNGNTDFALSATGTLVYQAGAVQVNEGTLVWLGPDGSEEVVDPRLSGIIEAPTISPDGRRLAFDLTEGGERQIWIYDLADGTTSVLTTEGDWSSRPAWAPSGREVGFISRRDGPQAFYTRPWDRSGPARLLRGPSADSVIIWEGLWTPEEDLLLYRELPRVGIQHLFYSAPHPDSAGTRIPETQTYARSLSLSPDGRWLAYESPESGRRQVYVRPFPGPGGTFTISDGGGISPIWAKTGNEIFYISDGSWMVAQVRTEPEFEVESRRRFASASGYSNSTVIQRYDVAPDGQRILAIRVDDGGDRDVIVLNFFEELREQDAN